MIEIQKQTLLRATSLKDSKFGSFIFLAQKELIIRIQDYHHILKGIQVSVDFSDIWPELIVYFSLIGRCRLKNVGNISEKTYELYLVELQAVSVRYNQKQFPLNMFFWKLCEVSGAGNTD